MEPLPVDEICPEALRLLQTGNRLVLEATPGAGKTTRFPLAILKSDVCPQKKILVVQPRRIAARMAAEYVAELDGGEVGGVVGYQVRFEGRVGKQTRLIFMTEGLLLRRLIVDPSLDGVGVVIFDEFHERNLAGDLGLAIIRELQSRTRSDLRLVVMSATLDAKPIADYLGGCPILRAEGRRFEVDVEHLQVPDQRPLDLQVRSAILRLMGDGVAGDLLVFLPGMGEILRSMAACEAMAKEADLLLLPLHGSLPPQEQRAAVRPAAKRKIIFSTNVAETSVTIDGIEAVVDSGLAREASYNRESGSQALTLREISQASATQRAGRAGRTRAGRCTRLYTRQALSRWAPHRTPEICRVDLSDAVLMSRSLGFDLAHLELLDCPPAVACERAVALLARLGALSPDGEITPIGKRLLRFPAHPRFGRLIIAAQEAGAAGWGCLMAAVLSERDIRLRSAPPLDAGASDLLALCDLFLQAEKGRFRSDALRRLGLHAGAVANVRRARDQLLRLSSGGAADVSEAALLKCILIAFPDQVASVHVASEQRRGGTEVLMCSGGRSRLDDRSVVVDVDYVVALSNEERGLGAHRQRLTRMVSQIEPDWLIELFDDGLEETEELVWNAAGERVEQVCRLQYGAVILDETRKPAQPGPKTCGMLVKQVLAKGAASLVDLEDLEGLTARMTFVGNAMPEVDMPEVAAGSLEDTLLIACRGLMSFKEVRDISVTRMMLDNLSHEQRDALRKFAPEQITLPGGRRLCVHYPADKPPWVESYLQNFFGMADGPTVANRRVSLTLHLWAPNRRPVQVTQDLAGFWERHYSDLRKTLSRRYPKHSWPDDPLSAQPRLLRKRRNEAHD